MQQGRYLNVRRRKNTKRIVQIKLCAVYKNSPCKTMHFYKLGRNSKVNVGSVAGAEWILLFDGE